MWFLLWRVVSFVGGLSEPAEFLEESLSFEWSPGYWQGWRESSNPYRQFKSERDRSLTVHALQLRDGERVLEVGCGYGWITEALHRAANIRWTGLDRSESMVRRLRSSPRFQSAPDAFVGDARRLPLPSASFDKVLCTLRMNLWRSGKLLACCVQGACWCAA
jgi:SAM-dependent methyltransferase